jgi:hypothetical protein
MKFSRARTLVPKLLLTFATVAAAYSANAALDSLTVIRSILNASPMDVQLKLGKPDNGVTPSVDCDHLPSCTKATYQKGKFEALFYKDSLKWLEIKGNDLFDKNAPEVIGFSNLPPTFANSFTRSWRSAIRVAAGANMQRFGRSGNADGFWASNAVFAASSGVNSGALQISTWPWAR